MGRIKGTVQSVGKRIRVLALCAAIIFALPVLYLLSAGPIVFMEERGAFSVRTQESLKPVYGPLGGIVESPSIAGKAFRAYLRLWYKGNDLDEDQIDRSKGR